MGSVLPLSPKGGNKNSARLTLGRGSVLPLSPKGEEQNPSKIYGFSLRAGVVDIINMVVDDK